MRDPIIDRIEWLRYASRDDIVNYLETINLSLGGIYIILNFNTKKFYPGSTSQFRHRWKGHLIEFNKGIHTSRLQNSWNKHNGLDAFIFIPTEIVLQGNLIPLEWTKARLVREQVVLDYYPYDDRSCAQRYNDLYNTCRTAGAPPLYEELPKETQIAKSNKAKASMIKTLGNQSAEEKERKCKISVDRWENYDDDMRVHILKAQDKSALEQGRKNLTNEQRRKIYFGSWGADRYIGYMLRMAEKYNVSIDCIRSICGCDTAKLYYINDDYNKKFAEWEEKYAFPIILRSPGNDLLDYYDEQNTLRDPQKALIMPPSLIFHFRFRQTDYTTQDLLDNPKRV